MSLRWKQRRTATLRLMLRSVTDYGCELPAGSRDRQAGRIPSPCGLPGGIGDVGGEDVGRVTGPGREAMAFVDQVYQRADAFPFGRRTYEVFAGWAAVSSHARPTAKPSSWRATPPKPPT